MVVSGDESLARRLRPAAPPSSQPAYAETTVPKPETGSDATPESKDADSGQSGVTTADPASGGPPITAPGGRHRRIPFAHAARRLPSPRQIVVAAAHGVRDWARGPSGRLVLPGLLLLLMVSASGSAGALLVRAAAPTPGSEATTGQDPDLGPTAAPSAPATPVYPTATLPATDTTPGPNLGRPSDPLAGWAQEVGSRVGIPPAALQAYGYAEWVLSQTTPGCQLRWTTLAAIGKVESDHGRTQGATIGPDGEVRPQIVGPALDGNGDRKLISDTDDGQLDGDTSYDRAVGPMQFIPTTWQQDGADADGDGVKNPHDIDDAALAAAQYLCKGGRDLTKPQDWWNAILSYNNVQAYAEQVFAAANEYGTASRG